MVPYSAEVLASLYARCNEALWPLHLVALAAAATLAVLALRQGRWRSLWVALAAGWIFVGAVFFGQWMSELTWGAGYLAVGFCLQGLVLLVAGVRPPRVVPSPSFSRRVFGFVAIAVALVGYPLAAAIGPYGWQGTPVVGLAPLPTALLTFGVLAFVGTRPAMVLGVLPVLWATYSGYESWVLGLHLDLSLPSAALVWLVLMEIKRR